MDGSRRATIVLNEASRGAAAMERGALEEACAAAGLNARIVRVRHRNVMAAAERAAAESEVIVAAGGDGTVSAVGTVAVRTGATLGVVPLGTLNHFARDAGIPRQLRAALATIVGGRPKVFDVGEVNGAIFLNNASLGMYPRLVWERQLEEANGRGRWTAFAMALARSWRHYRTVDVRMIVDSKALERETPFVFVGNGEYRVEGLALGRRRSIDSGRLSVFLAPDSDRLGALALPFRALLKRLSSDARFESFFACDVTLETATPEVSLALDGELMMAASPFRFSVRRRALRALVPEA